jgi:hypothetical protein
MEKKSLAERKDRKDARLKRGLYAKKKEDQENRVDRVDQAGNTSDMGKAQ